jgi:hypothetical protein
MGTSNHLTALTCHHNMAPRSAIFSEEVDNFQQFNNNSEQYRAIFFASCASKKVPSSSTTDCSFARVRNTLRFRGGDPESCFAKSCNKQRRNRSKLM